MTIIWFLIVGLVAGALARLIVPGRDPMGLLATMVLGIVGSLVGGFLAKVLFNDNNGVGIFGSVVGAVIVLLIWNTFVRERRRGASGLGRRVIS
jgi:uncharacterized membrane protein YeaQ/YmgE (transglycosylase-associated protein family)